MSDPVLSGIPEEAVTAAAEAMEDAAMRWVGRDLGTIHRDDIAREALAAAMPAIRAALADEIRTYRDADRRSRYQERDNDEPCDAPDWQCHAAAAYVAFDNAALLVAGVQAEQETTK